MKYVIGIDGGGTKTTALLADKKGELLSRVEAGPTSPRNIGAEKAAKTLLKIIKDIEDEKEAARIIIGLASVEEQPSYIKEIEKHFPEEVRKKSRIVSDQLVAFRAGTEKEDGLLLIAGTGCVARGWRSGREAKVSGWGWLEDKGSAFWLGQKVLQAILSAFDGRGPETLLKEIVFSELEVGSVQELLDVVYKDPLEVVPSFSSFCDAACKRKDEVARGLMKKAGEELALTSLTLVKKLNFKGSFPFVLVGSMFNSKIVLDTVKNRVGEEAPKVKFIRPQEMPAVGAIKIALKDL